MQAMMASLFEIPLEMVPHFFHDGCDPDTFHQRINDWLRPMNLGYLPIGYCGPEFFQALGLRGWHTEAYGPAVRGVQHACASLDGVVTHDPHPSKTGLQAIEGFGVFVVLDPSKPACLVAGRIGETQFE